MQKKAILFGLLAGLLFGIATPISKLLLTTLSSYSIAGLLYFGAALFFLPTILKNRKTEINLQIIKTNWIKLTGIIVFGGILGPLLLLAGLRNANSSSVSIWLNFELIATAIIGVLFFKEHLSRHGLMGVVLTFVAGVIISFNENSAGLKAGILVVLACVSWGIDNHLTSIIDGVSSKATTFIKGTVGGIVNITLGLLLFRDTNLFQMDVVIALLLGMVSYGISIVLYISASQMIGATRGQILFSISPFWGIAGAAFLLSEPITWKVILSFTLLLIGIVFSNIRGHEHYHNHAETEHIHLHSHVDQHHTHEHENTAQELMHIHIHTHDAIAHEHDHLPDLHHRHDHI